jgi:RimJ/RimL family protein N-acetyltransferase
MNQPARLLRGKRVRLTALDEGDIPTIARWYCDTVFLRLSDAVAAYPRSEAEILRRLQKWREDENTFTFAVRPVDEDDDTLLGLLQLQQALHRSV